MSTSAGQRPMRADARRNYERVLAEARRAFLEQGAEASLEDIARRAGVGIGTLYRHFPTRLALQEAVYREQVAVLAAKAYELTETLPPGEAMRVWMRSFTEYANTKRGLMQTLKAVIDRHSELFARCHEEIRDAAALVLGRAQDAGVVRPDLTVTDLLKLIHAVSVATERAPEDTARLLSFMFEGLKAQH
jgi:AcrR family transcriptional regulator